jgi:hypothetical protein
MFTPVPDNVFALLEARKGSLSSEARCSGDYWAKRP